MERLSSGEIVFKIIAYVFVGAFAILALYPLVYSISASISGIIPFNKGEVVLFPKAVTFGAYKEIITDKTFWITYSNTLFYTLFGTLWSMVISVAGAYVLAKNRTLFRRKLNFFIVFSMWFNAGMIPLYINYYNMHVNNRWGLVIAFGVQAYNIILLRSFFSNIPSEIEEAARIDGANEFQILTKVYLPMSKAALATVALFYAISRWNGFFWAMLLLNKNQDQNLQVYLRLRMQETQTLLDNMNAPWAYNYAPDAVIYAMIVCSIIPVLIVYPYIQKYFAKGVNLGGVKG